MTTAEYFVESDSNLLVRELKTVENGWGGSMKAIACVAVVVLCSALAATAQQPAAKSMPPAAEEVLQRMDKEILVAKTKAITALDKILKDTTKRGDLQGALAVKQEIDKLQGEIRPGGRVAGGSAFVGRWNGPGWTAECSQDGTIMLDNGMKGRWSESGNSVLVEFENGIRHELERTADGYAGVYKSGPGAVGNPVKYARSR